jgi:hypothetical protein
MDRRLEGVNRAELMARWRELGFARKPVCLPERLPKPNKMLERDAGRAFD